MSAVPPRVERDAGAIPRAAATGPSGEPAVVASRLVALDAALATARERYRQRCPGSLAAHRAASDWMPGGNTRTVLYHGPFPLRFATGRSTLSSRLSVGPSRQTSLPSSRKGSRV